ncbi:nuclear receptor coactivator 5 isoform X2 [Anopheles coustani]|uniref:nuclear receptor coactivator 5 isoform X2 n=1 Tax=Anopheles coustani TaxID=139045 RepID=UPI00265A866C|nr:nuclear receptor coactivator 5 isoform X2 [Anopheles coustani]
MAVEPINSRVYVGGLGDQATLQNLEELFKDFKPYQDLSLLRGFGFIQFHDEQSAQKAIKAMNGKVFKGRKLNVKIANDNRAKKGLLPRGHPASGPVTNRDRSPIDGALLHVGKRGYLAQPYSVADLSSVYPETTIGPAPHRGAESNDCEIIVVTKELTAYAESIEARLKRAGMTVDLLFPNNDVPIGKVLANRASQGTFYCIVITPENQERNSITVNVLYGIPAEHRNMPTEDAINFIIKNFAEKQRQERAPQLPGHTFHLGGTAAPQPVQPLELHSVPPTQDKHPEAVQNMINLLAANRPLTVLQYERLIKYLTERKETQIRLELGEDVDTSTASALIPPIIVPTKSKMETERELQKKILDIMNKPSIIGFAKSSNTFDHVSSEGKFNSTALPTSVLLHDVKVQRALDTLLQSQLGHFNSGYRI